MPSAHNVEILPKEPVLLIDPQATLGVLLAEKLKNEFHVVLATHHTSKALGIYHVQIKPHTKHLPAASYAYTVVFFSGETYLFDTLYELAENAGKSNGRLLIIISITEAREILIEKIKTVATKAYIVVIGDVFGTLHTISEHSIIDKFISTAKHKKHIALSEQGLLPLYPVAIEDTLEGIIRILFSRYPYSRPLFLFSQTIMTELSLARWLQKKEPLLQIDFSQQVPLRQIVLPDGEYVFENYPVEEKLHALFIAANEEPLSYHPLPVRKQPKRVRQLFVRPKYVAFSLLSMVVIPFILSLLLAVIGVACSLLISRALNGNNFATVMAESSLADTAFSASVQAGKITQAELGLFGLQKTLTPYLQLLNSGEVESSIAGSVVQLATSYKQNSNLSKEQFVQQVNNLQNSLDRLTSMQVNGELYGKTSELLIQNQGLVNFIINTSPSWPSLMGYDKKQTFLLLLQNNAELRPTGGFFGSYGLITMQNGKMTDFTVHNVYDADGQLKEHIEPPYPIRRYIPQVHLYLRDSNFDPDFPTTASVAANMLYKETNTQVDGVIGIDLNVVKNIIGSLGGLYIPAYHETVTADNFFLKAEEHSEKNTFAGSTQKQDYLNAVFRALQVRLENKQNISYQELATSLSTAITQKDIIFAFADSAVESLFLANGYADSLIDTRDIQKNTFNDYLAINEANIGVNKVNYYVKRRISQATAITGDGKINEQIDLYYVNTSTGAWPGGGYRNYLRLLVPQGATLTGVTINGQSQTIIPAVTDFQTYEAKDFKSPPGFEVDQSQELGKTVFGMVLTVPAGNYQHVVISYMLPSSMSLSSASEFYYRNKVIKQPGTENDPFTFTLSTPQGFSVLDQDSKSNQISKQFHLFSDTDFTYHIVKE